MLYVDTKLIWCRTDRDQREVRQVPILQAGKSSAKKDNNSGGGIHGSRSDAENNSADEIVVVIGDDSDVNDFGGSKVMTTATGRSKVQIGNSTSAAASTQDKTIEDSGCRREEVVQINGGGTDGGGKTRLKDSGKHNLSRSGGGEGVVTAKPPAFPQYAKEQHSICT